MMGNCLNCFHSFRTENKLRSHESVQKAQLLYCKEEFDNLLKYN